MSPLRGLRDPRAFPSFESCPDENSIDLQYYSTKNGYYFRPSCHWCLLAKFTHVEYFIRLRLHVRDKSGHEVPIAFYPKGEEEPTLDQYRKGYTVAILYPHQHGFMDMTVGTRQEKMHHIKVVYIL